MLLLLFIILVVIMLLISPFMRFIIRHPFLCGKYFILDKKDYYLHKRYNEFKDYGRIFTFTASGSKAFGSGKTLSMVNWVRSVYRKYNGLPVWDQVSQDFVKQRIIVISNVEFKDIPFIPFRGREQFVDIDKLDHTEHDIIIFCVDEAGQEFNSRNYKDNLPTMFLNRLLQVRKHKIVFAMTSQRFGFLDKVLRQTCNHVTTCRMWWRIVMLQDFDAYALENCSNTEMIKPLSTRFYLATNDLFNSYDTTYTVQALKQQLDSGDLLDTAEILQRIGDDSDYHNAKTRLRGRKRKTSR